LAPASEVVWFVAAPGISASPSEDNLRYFNVMILGPSQSPYEGSELWFSFTYILLGLLNFWFASLSAHQRWLFSCNSGLNRWVLTFLSLWFWSLPRFHFAIFFSSPVLFYGVQYDFSLVKKCVGHIMVIWQSSWNNGQWS